MNRSRLPLHEWVTVLGVGALFLTFAGISCKFSEGRRKIVTNRPPILSKKCKVVTILVSGAVEKKGEVQVRTGDSFVRSIWTGSIPRRS